MTDNISMLNLKRSAFIFLIHLLLIPTAFGEGDISESGVRAIGGPEESAETSQNSILSRMLEHERVQPAKTACDGKKDDGETTYGDGIYKSYGECIWGHLSAADQELLSEAIKTEQAKEADANRENTNEYDSLDLGFKRDEVELTPEMQKMQSFMAEKMKKALYGEGDKEKVAGHGNFYKMYKSSLGKNLIQSISAYCMGTDFDLAKDGRRYLYEKDKLTENYEKWENALKETEGNNKTVQAVTLWNLCLSHIQFVCLDAKPPKISSAGGIEKPDFVRSAANEISYITQADIDRDPNDDITQDKLGQTKSDDSAGDSYCQKDDEDEKVTNCTRTKFKDARSHACIVYRSMKDTKYALQTIDKITNRLSEVAGGGAGGVIAAAGVAGKEENDAELYVSSGENSINAMTTYNSNELIEESGLAGDYNKAKEEFYSKCFNEESRTIINSDECNQYLDTNRSEKENEIAEFLLRKRAMEKKLESDFQDPEKLKKAIRELGYSDEKVAELMEIQDGEFIKKQLRKRMAAETDALHKALVDKMNATTSTEDGSISQDKDQDTLAKIGESLSSKTDRMKQLIRFNNIVSGFLEVENSESGERSKNLLGLQQELGVIDGSGDAELERISRSVSETGIREGGSTDSDNATLGADTIDNELIYIQGGGNGGN